MGRANDDRLSKLIKGASTAFAPSEELRCRLRGELAARVVEADAPWRDTLAGKGRRLGLALAAAVLVVAVFALWPSEPPVPIAMAWWQGPPAAWAQEITTALQAVESVTCRETWSALRGSDMPAALSDREYFIFSTSSDSYRRDKYYDGKLVLTQWYTPSGDGNMRQTDVHYEQRTYCIMLHKGSYGERSPISRMTLLVRFIDRADAMLGTSIIDGRECVGFEISADKYGDNPATDKDRIWFDVDTRLPVRVEYEHQQADNGTTRTFIRRQDNFNWAPNLTADYFQPVIPDSFVEVQN